MTIDPMTFDPFFVLVLLILTFTMAVYFGRRTTMPRILDTLADAYVHSDADEKLKAAVEAIVVARTSEKYLQTVAAEQVYDALAGLLNAMDRQGDSLRRYHSGSTATAIAAAKCTLLLVQGQSD